MTKKAKQCKCYDKVDPIFESLQRLQQRFPDYSYLRIVSNARKTVRPWLRGQLSNADLLDILTKYEKFNA